jgi:hypothetical protein
MPEILASAAKSLRRLDAAYLCPWDHRTHLNEGQPTVIPLLLYLPETEFQHRIPCTC